MSERKRPSVEALQRADKIVSLIDSPGLDALTEEAVRKAERMERSLVVRSKSIEGATREDWRFQAGFQAGMEYLLNLPAAARFTLDSLEETNP